LNTLLYFTWTAFFTVADVCTAIAARQLLTNHYPKSHSMG